MHHELVIHDGVVTEDEIAPPNDSEEPDENDPV